MPSVRLMIWSLIASPSRLCVGNQSIQLFKNWRDYASDSYLLILVFRLLTSYSHEMSHVI